MRENGYKFKYLHTCKVQVFIQPTLGWELTKGFDNPESFFFKNIVFYV